jgi:hypothetical protein
MVIPSEYIQIISAGIYAMALFFTIVTFRRKKILDQITLSNNIFSELRNLDLERAKIPSESQYMIQEVNGILGYLTVSTGCHL